MSKQPIYQELVSLLNDEIMPFDIDKKENILSVLEHIGDARFVLMGEASHGTEEFYQSRVALSKLLIEKKGFHAVAIEGDWPAAYFVNQYLQGFGEKNSEKEALNAFKRFPAWMWRNSVLPPFLRWLREHNDRAGDVNQKVGFYGLDLYSLYDSMLAIIEYLRKHQPDAVEKAIARYNCFDHMAVDPQVYGYLVSTSVKHACVKEVTDQLIELQHEAFSQLKKHSQSDNESLYYASQNARLVKNSEEYYRAMFEPGPYSWNLRDQHMAQTLSNLVAHIESKLSIPSKIIIWAHNSHIGDARATEMVGQGEINLGQIVREQYDTASYLLGFSTYDGTVRAASEWDGNAEIMPVNPALEGSYEALFHGASSKNFFLNLRGESHLLRLLKQDELQRAIGVIYIPESERMSHYYFSKLPYQFDGIIHFDRTHAVTPFKREDSLGSEEFPETYPTGM